MDPKMEALRTQKEREREFEFEFKFETTYSQRSPPPFIFSSPPSSQPQSKEEVSEKVHGEKPR